MKKGFLFTDFENIDISEIRWLESIKNYCDYLVVGLPSDNLYLRMKEQYIDAQYEFDKKRDFLLTLKAVDEVIAIDIDNMMPAVNYELIKYNVYFIGSHYGFLCDMDLLFFKAKGIDVISLVPLKLQNDFDSILQISLEYEHFDKKIVLFGTGKYFSKYMEKLGLKYKPCYAVDNCREKWRQYKEGIEIKSPSVLQQDAKDVLVIICCKDYNEIIKQLSSYNIYDYRIMLNNPKLAYWEEHRTLFTKEQEYLQKAHETLKKMMFEFDRVCTLLGVKYYVTSGSLIGVVRHKGLIPWDDDIDIAMFREDYEVFKRRVLELWENTDYELVSYDELGNDVFNDFMTRIVYKGDFFSLGLFKKIRKGVRKDILNHMVLDIYILDNTKPGLRHSIQIGKIKLIYLLCMGHRSYIDYSEYTRISKINIIIIKLLNAIGARIPLKLLFKWYNRVATYAKNVKTNYCFESGGVINYISYIYNQNLLGEGKRFPFYDFNVMVPVDTDGFLRAKGYGNYMDYPEVHRRKPSHTPRSCNVIW